MANAEVPVPPPDAGEIPSQHAAAPRPPPVPVYFWPNWDWCLRIRHTTVAAFVERGLDREGFPRITRRDGVFALLVELATLSFSGRRYLKSVGDRLALDDNQRDRLHVIKRALRNWRTSACDRAKGIG